MQTIEAQQPIYNLSSEHFLAMLKTGAASVVAKENFINQINYFPVSDHDTGSNLAALMRYLSSASYTTAQLSQLLKQIADASLIGACGNSGMILSAFFIGFAAPAEEVKENHFTTKRFVQCIEQGVVEATRAVMEPVEGTILSVMKAWAKSLRDLAHHSNDFILLFEKSIAVAHEALEKTRFQLRANKQQHVVDAGAFGFMQFLLGMYKQLVEKNKLQVITSEEQADPIQDSHQHDERPDHQYCFEVLLKNEHDSDKLKKIIQQYGNSLVINKSPSYQKIHIHTDTPIDLCDDLKKYGTLCHQKIDDMQHQWMVTHQRKYPIAIVTDTAADLPRDWVQQHQVHLLPVQIRVGENIFLDSISINLQKLYQLLQEGNDKAGTSPPTPESVKRTLNFLASHYESIIVISASSKLSSLHQIISTQANTINSKKVSVIDSERFSAAQGLLVMKAIQLVERGYEHQAIVNKIEDLRQKTHFLFSADEFKTMIRSGRMPKMLGLIAQWSGLKPLLGVKADGKPRIVNVAIGRKWAEKQLIKKVKTIAAQGQVAVEQLVIVHTQSIDKANRLAMKIFNETGVKINHIYETACGIGLHGGRGCIGVALLMK